MLQHVLKVPFGDEGKIGCEGRGVIIYGVFPKWLVKFYT